MPHPPPFDLDRLAAGELDDGSAGPLRAHLESCPACRTYLATIEAERAELLARKPPGAFALQVEDRTGKSNASGRSRAWNWSLAAAAAAAVLVIVLAVALREKEPEVRWMGGDAVVKVYLDHEGQVSFLAEQHPQPGDRLRYEITMPPGKIGYAALLAMEGAKVFPVLPDQPDAAPFRVSGTFWMPGSTVLERGTEPLQLLLVVRPHPFDLRAAMAEIDSARRTSDSPRIPGLAHELVLNLSSP